MVLRRRLATVGILAAALTACGGSGLLDTLGDRSHEYVQGSTTIPVVTAAPIDITGGIPLQDLDNRVGWFNDSIDGSSSNEVAVVISAVWQRGDGENRFIQATPHEISVALPGIQFLTVVPRTAESITSQLVYDTASATLDVGVSAAFGVWSGEPYESPDDRLIVLRVGQDVSISPSDGLQAVEVDEGVSLIWSDGLYQYELFCADLIVERQCRRIARSVVPLEILVGPGIPED